MKLRTKHEPRAQRANGFQREGANWVLVAGSALLSTLSVCLGYKLKQVLDAKQQETSDNDLKGNGTFTERKKSASNPLHHNSYCFTQDDDGCYNCAPASGSAEEMTRPEGSSPLSTASATEHLELPEKPVQRPNSSDSTCMSESGSVIVYSKRDIVRKMRQQLKRRDDMILEMEDQIANLQSTLSAQLSHPAHLQSMLDSANNDLLESERKVQRLRKAIADHCLRQVDSGERPPIIPIWPANEKNGHSNGYLEPDKNFERSGKGRGENDTVEMLRKEVSELKEVIEGKEFLLQILKEQKVELAIKVKDLQQKLDSHLPSIL